MKISLTSSKCFTHSTTCAIYKLTCTTSEKKWYNKLKRRRKMKKQLKRIAVASMAVCLTASMAGCAPAADEEEGIPGAPHIGIIFTQAGLGGNSFNDLALEGVRKAAEDFGITYDQIEPKSVADEEIIQDEMASSEEYDLIICVGDEQVDALENVASVYTGFCCL